MNIMVNQLTIILCVPCIISTFIFEDGSTIVLSSYAWQYVFVKHDKWFFFRFLNGVTKMYALRQCMVYLLSFAFFTSFFSLATKRTR